MAELEMRDYRDVSIMLGEDRSDDDWNEICLIILEELRLRGYAPLEVCIY